ncbi:hypothetical protein C8R45DRAFT_935879 [Mycena sanguinolenta]|nr:hypothetical protein C8R45DRAFT_935879 [Mycena sanguinolenta]
MRYGWLWLLRWLNRNKMGNYDIILPSLYNELRSTVKHILNSRKALSVANRCKKVHTSSSTAATRSATATGYRMPDQPPGGFRKVVPQIDHLAGIEASSRKYFEAANRGTLTWTGHGTVAVSIGDQQYPHDEWEASVRYPREEGQRRPEGARGETQQPMMEGVLQRRKGGQQSDWKIQFSSEALSSSSPVNLRQTALCRSGAQIEAQSLPESLSEDWEDMPQSEFEQDGIVGGDEGLEKNDNAGSEGHGMRNNGTPMWRKVIGRRTAYGCTHARSDVAGSTSIGEVTRRGAACG